MTVAARLLQTLSCMHSMNGIEEIWPQMALKKKEPADTSKLIPFSNLMESGKLPFPEIVEPLYTEINELYGTDLKPPKSN